MQLFVAEENPWRKFPSERTCVTGLTKFGRVLLNLFFSGETLRWVDAVQNSGGGYQPIVLRLY
jgi:hypothetical protein